MKCKKCYCPTETEDITVDIVEFDEEKLDVQAVCPECDYRVYGFISIAGMIGDDD